MGCASSLPPVCFKNKGGWCPRPSDDAQSACFICADQSYTIRHTVLSTHLSGVTDLVRLIESYIPLDCPHFPLWYIFAKRTEFYQAKPQTMFGHVVWNYYALQHPGVALYVIFKGTYCEAVWVDEIFLKLQILEKHFQSGRHPNCLKGFRTIMKNEPLPSFRLISIADHFHFWIKKFTYQINHFSRMYLELEGIYPLIWSLFVFILRSKNVPFSTKNQIIRFLVKDSYFCTSIQENWTNLAGEFLNALSASSSLRYNILMEMLSCCHPTYQEPVMALFENE